MIIFSRNFNDVGRPTGHSDSHTTTPSPAPLKVACWKQWSYLISFNYQFHYYTPVQFVIVQEDVGGCGSISTPK